MKLALRQVVKATTLRRHHVAAARMLVERNALAVFGWRQKKNTGRILCYHSIEQPIFGVNDVSSAQFRRHIKLALRAGYRFVPASQIAETGGGAKDLAVTFDDATISVASHAEPILRAYSIPFTVFPVTSWCDHRMAWSRENILSWLGLERLMAKGVEIGSHSATHPNFAHLSFDQMVEELETSRHEIQRHLGLATNVFAIPLGQSTNWSPEAAMAATAAGYDIIYAQAEETRPRGTIPRTFVTRFDDDRIFKALLGGAFDGWEEWM
jgi:peptidoglycan/xylan/chitin deacetylase (PgdA/CDA1 family)